MYGWRLTAQLADDTPTTTKFLALDQIRHSFATWRRHSGGADLADIQNLYGHTDPTATRIHVAPTLAKQHDAIRHLCVVTDACDGARSGVAAGGGYGLQ